MASNRARNSNKTAVPVVTLATIVAAGEAGMFVSKAVSDPLVAAGHVEVNPAMTNEAGEVATRATPAGIAAVQAAPQTETQTQAAAPAVQKERPSFMIEENVPMPEVTPRAGGRTEMYPFDALPAPKTESDGNGGTRTVMASFFVPNKEPKSLASTITGARNRYAREVPGQTRTMRGGKTVPMTEIVRDFKVYPDTKDGVKGSRVWRTK